MERHASNRDQEVSSVVTLLLAIPTLETREKTERAGSSCQYCR